MSAGRPHSVIVGSDRSAAPLSAPPVPSMAGSLGGRAATVSGPLVLRDLVDAVAAGRRVSALGVAALLGLGLVRFAAALVRRLYAGRVSYDVEYDLRNAVYDHLSRLDFAAHDRLETGQAMSRAGSDVRTIQMLLAFLPLMAGNVVMLGLSLAVMTVLSPVLTLVALAVLPAVAVASARLRDRVFPATWDAEQQAGEVAGVVDEALPGAPEREATARPALPIASRAGGQSLRRRGPGGGAPRGSRP